MEGDKLGDNWVRVYCICEIFFVKCNDTVCHRSPLHTKGDDDVHESEEEEHPTPSPEVSSEDNAESSSTCTSVTSSIDIDAFMGPEYLTPVGNLPTLKIVGDNIHKDNTHA